MTACFDKPHFDKPRFDKQLDRTDSLSSLDYALSSGSALSSLDYTRSSNSILSGGVSAEQSSDCLSSAPAPKVLTTGKTYPPPSTHGPTGREVPLHSDEFVTLYRDRLVVHWYYFPFAGDKVVPLDQVRRVHTGYFAGATPPRYLPSPEAAAKSGVYGGKVLDMWDWKHWGMALNFDTWWSCDLGRDGKDNWIAIELDDTHVKVGFAVDTHTHTGLLAKIHRATLAARKELDRPYDLCQ
ncbi:hypothetical protein H696_01875 [Fonticula alba]|uniref:Uncharacterized protein n=1 Tax=Fonticula alba TaxID=691883 RepID=A0A058ZAD0_FONAL|nr:hypothetical protein H696_01875 [Fonticula alba]KCV70928.1 hypothetical protein H696_01875 [Fonticula alba]|eukprot:XP_009494052.1 hypothetical protein H696_01875 [Fonticula alba]